MTDNRPTAEQTAEMALDLAAADSPCAACDARLATAGERIAALTAERDAARQCAESASQSRDWLTARNARLAEALEAAADALEAAGERIENLQWLRDTAGAEIVRQAAQA